MKASEMKNMIENGNFDDNMSMLYGAEAVSAQHERYGKAVDAFINLYGDRNAYILSVPGRSEVGGNHTDHNHGRVLACAVDLDVIAVAAVSSGNTVHVKSEGFPMDEVNLDDLQPHDDEKFTSKALIRGICARLSSLGCKVGGFDAYTTSNVLKGSGLSSSAAFEVMVANMVGRLFNDGKVEPVLMAKTGQYAEREYFGKPCGLMDQTACAVGGFITIDFANPENPIINKVAFDIAKNGYSLCIVDTAGDHADLNGDYTAIRSEMCAVAGLLGHGHLRECNEAEFFRRLPEIRGKLGDRAVLRAIHFFGDNARVPKEVKALQKGDFAAFLQHIIDSGRSSFMYLQNAYSIKSPDKQGLSLALALSEKVLTGSGAWRVHGGGFAGTIQAFVPHDKLAEYAGVMDATFGKNACHNLMVRPVGAYCFD